MTTKTAPKVTDIPIKFGKHTMQPGTLGHRRWLLDRKNKTLTTGKIDFDSIIEICFAYVTEPIELQKFQGQKAKDTIRDFGDALTNEQFLVLQEHAETQLLKFAETSVIPKKKASPRTGGKSIARARKQ
jgi:hypothetical protein